MSQKRLGINFTFYLANYLKLCMRGEGSWLAKEKRPDNASITGNVSFKIMLRMVRIESRFKIQGLTKKFFKIP